MPDAVAPGEIHEKNDDVIRMEGDEKKLRQVYPYNAEFLNPFQLKQSLTAVQMLKALLMTLILPIRLLLILVVLGLAWILCLITIAGLPKEEAEGLEPLSGWRRRWAKPFISKMCRFVFFLGGWMWVTFKGQRASKREAPILLVMPHSSFLDTALVTILDCPGLVVRDFTAKAPFFGDLIRYTQPLFVNSEDPNSRHQISEAIRKRVQSNKDFEQLMLFPEGGCGNREALLQFKLGAFSPGVPVQPVFVRYNNNLDTITWTWDGPGAWNRIWLSLTQFRTYCEIEFLPVYKPSKIEKSNPRLFANNVQNYVSSWTGCPMTHFAIEDARFVPVAKSRKLPLTAPLVKFLRLRAFIGRQDVDPAEELRDLRDRNRDVSHFQGDAPRMAEYIGLDRCPEALRDFFRTVNQKEKESLDVRIYAACLCLIRQDMETRLKLKTAFQAFTSESEVEHLSTILLLWKGIPANLINNRNLSSFGSNHIAKFGNIIGTYFKSRDTHFRYTIFIMQIKLEMKKMSKTAGTSCNTLFKEDSVG